MPEILLETRISAPIERVFDLARSIDAHMDSAAPTSDFGSTRRKPTNDPTS